MMQIGIGLGILMSAGRRVASAPLWTPSDLPGILEWWDAADGVTTATGVSSWAGRMGSLTAANATGSQQPAYDTSGAYPKLVGDGSDDRLQISSVAGFPYGSSPGAIFVVANASDVSGNRVLTGYGSTAPGTSGRSLILFTTSAVFDLGYSPVSNVTRTGIADTIHVVTGRTPTAPGEVPTIDVSGVKVSGTSTVTIDTKTGSPGFIFGRPQFGNYNPTADIYMIGFVEGNVSDADVKRIEGWAAHKLNDAGVTALLSELPGGHPYKTEAPRVTS